MTPSKHLVQVVEGNSAARRLLRMVLEPDGFRIVVSDTTRIGERTAIRQPPDVMIIDPALGDDGGIGLIRSMRVWSSVPILVVSEQTSERQKIRAFDAGADDYILIPYYPSELLLRVRAAVRRHARGPLPAGMLEFENLSIDLGRRSARRLDGSELNLTRTEYRILETLCRNGGRVVSQSSIVREVWGPEAINGGELRGYIAALRKKIETSPAAAERIITVPGQGYRLAI